MNWQHLFPRPHLEVRRNHLPHHGGVHRGSRLREIRPQEGQTRLVRPEVWRHPVVPLAVRQEPHHPQAELCQQPVVLRARVRQGRAPPPVQIAGQMPARKRWRGTGNEWDA